MLDDITWIWSKDKGEYPQGSPVWGWMGFLLRIKCTVCVLLRLEGHDPYVSTCVPVAIGALWVSQGWNGPGADWSELGVDIRWWCWRFYRYRNGI